MITSALYEENSENEKTDFCLKINSLTNIEWPVKVATLYRDQKSWMMMPYLC
jgi:hypothetical protein